MITKEEKIVYKVKEASFTGTNELCDANGNIVDLIKDLTRIFPDRLFDISVSSSEKSNLDISDFEIQE